MKRMLSATIVILTSLLTSNAAAQVKTAHCGEALAASIRLMRLEQTGAHPFHLKAQLPPYELDGATHSADIEEYWMAPDKYRRVVHSDVFSQTIVVNGARRYETHTGDYLPQWLHDAEIAVFNVVEPASEKTYASLPDDSVERIDDACSRVTFQARSSNGADKSWWNVGSSGLGGEIYSFDDGQLTLNFKRFEPFHQLSVAREIAIYPFHMKSPWELKITLLEDLPADVGELFDVMRSTPPRERLGYARLDEMELRRLSLPSPEMELPPVTKHPAEGVFCMRVVVDARGQVREKSYLSSNNHSLGGEFEKYVARLRFKPYVVNGVPTEAQAVMTFRYKTKVAGDQAAFDAPDVYFKRGRDLTSPRAGAQPFVLRAEAEMTVRIPNEEGLKTIKSSFEEHWRDAWHWRRAVSLDGSQLGQLGLMRGEMSRNGDEHRGLNQQLLDFGALLTAEGPGVAYYSPDSDWTCSTVEMLGEKLTRVAMASSHALGEGEYPRAAYFDAKGRLRARSQDFMLVVYSDFQDFNGVDVPRKIEAFAHGKLIASAQILSLTTDERRGDSYYDMPEAAIVPPLRIAW